MIIRHGEKWTNWNYIEKKIGRQRERDEGTSTWGRWQGVRIRGKAGRVGIKK